MASIFVVQVVFINIGMHFSINVIRWPEIQRDDTLCKSRVCIEAIEANVGNNRIREEILDREPSADIEPIIESQLTHWRQR